MGFPDQETLTQQLEGVLIQVEAALNAELPAVKDNPDISIEFEGHTATITVENEGMTAEETMTINTLSKRLEEKAKEINSTNPKQAVDEEIAPINNVEVEEEESAPSIKESILGS